ncbi:glycerate kinase [Helicovermis profundi]|uniref:Glycerate kinase n=1 Tax=Helicovermis profundi TaxID=3065157 RepID=A0AAU9E9U0_9FIRM|nr:glycerate kinase [Clostridia bacterium S502]
MKVMIIPDSFKGTLSSVEVSSIIKDEFLKHFPSSDIIEIPIGDGGEGTLAAIIKAKNGRYVDCIVKDPLGRNISARYGIYENVAVIEMAEASGIMRLKPNELNPFEASSFGTGQMILHAVKNGVSSILLGIGGSATNDGGVGMAKALGVKFFTKKPNSNDNSEFVEINEEGGKILSEIDFIDINVINKKLKNIPITVICDVNNPLTGLNGATYVYGPQKGLNSILLPFLESGMENYKNLLLKQFGVNVDLIKGAGAAGGIGAALSVFFNATLKSGVDVMLDLVEFDSLINDIDLVISGEGELDNQSSFGKLVTGISKRVNKSDSKLVLIVGSAKENYEKIYDFGVDALISTITYPIDKDEIYINANERLRKATNSLCRILKVGVSLSDALEF